MTHCPDLSKTEGFFWDVGLSVLKQRMSRAKWDKLVTLLEGLYPSPLPEVTTILISIQW